MADKIHLLESASRAAEQNAEDILRTAQLQELDETRKRAREATRKAIELEPQMKSLLRMLWNKEDPTKVGSEEDDLEVFYDDPDFKKLLAP